MSKVRIGFVGVGGMGQMAHLRNYVNIEDCEVAAIAELRPKLAKLVAQRYGVPNLYPSHREMLASEKLDGIVASQPFRLHATLLPELYPGTKFLFTEKPLAVSVDVGERLAGAAAAAGCTHMVGYHKRSDPATIHALKVIDDWKAAGQVGKLKYVRILMPAGDWIADGFVGLIKTDEPFPPVAWEPQDPALDKPAYDAYVSFVNYYIHQVNLMRHLLGEPYKVTFADRSGVLLTVQSASGVCGVIEMTPYQTTRAWEESALVAFERGYVKLSLPAPLAGNRCGTVEVYSDPGQGAAPVRSFPTLPWVHAMRQQALNFVKVIRGEIPPPCAAEEAVEDLRVAREYIRLARGG